VHLSDEAGIVEDVVGSEKLVYQPEVPPSKNVLQPPAD